MMNNYCKSTVWLLASMLLLFHPLRALPQDTAMVFNHGGKQSPSQAVNVQLKDALKELESRFKVNFNYNSAIINGKYILIDSDTFTEDLESTLQNILKSHELHYEKFEDNYYLILSAVEKEHKKKVNEKETREESFPPETSNVSENVEVENFSVASSVKDVPIKGKVRMAEDNSPFPGVTVFVKGTSNGTLTDVEGNFSISVPDEEGAVLVFSFMGYLTEEVSVKGRSEINISLIGDIQQLEEVVVVGYGEQSKATVIGAVATMTTKEVEDIPAANLSQLLQGRMPGVHAGGMSSGRPGAPASFRIRTIGTYGIEEPIFVIDGFIRDQAAFDLLDPSEVESISVLKDASASIYGVRGAGGAVVVTTKKGHEGKAKINYSGSHGMSDATSIPQMLSAYEHASLMNSSAFMRADDPSQYIPPFSENELELLKRHEYNWLDQAWQNSYTTRHALNISGGSNKVKYFGSGTYYRENGNLPGTLLEKYTLRLGMEANITNDLKASIQLSGDNRNEKRPFNRQDTNVNPMNGTFTSLLQTPRWVPPYINGLPVNHANMDSHPLEINRINSSANTQGSNLVLNMGLEYNVPVIKGLKAKMTYSQAESNTYSKQIRVNYDVYNFVMQGGNAIYTDQLQGTGAVRRVNNQERIQEQFARGRKYQMNGSLHYDNTFGKHHVAGFVMYEQAQGEGNDFLAMRQGMIVPNFERQEGFIAATAETRGGMSNSARLAFLGRLNYNFDEKYLLEATFRQDASVKFPPATRWGFFPSLALGWRISEEDFFKNGISYINNLKLRGSMGLVGNDQINPRQWDVSYNTAEGSYLGGSGRENHIQPARGGLALTGQTWEKSESYNGGIDIGLVNNLSFTFDAFYRYTYDILDTRGSTLPVTVGITNMPNENFGRMSSWGFDGSVNYKGKIAKDLFFNGGVNFAWARSKVIEKYQSEAQYGRWDDQIGIMPGGEVGYIALGMLRTQEDVDRLLEQYPGYTINGMEPRPGMIYFEDVDGPDGVPDGVITNLDRRIIAPAIGSVGFGFNIGLTYKGFRLGSNIGLGGFGQKVFYDNESIVAPSMTLNGPSFWADHWSPVNTDAAYPAPTNWGYNNQRSTFWMRDGVFMRVNNINASYDLPRNLAQRYGIPQFRIFFSGRNLWDIINPLDYKDSRVSRFNSYPVMRNWNLGLNITI